MPPTITRSPTGSTKTSSPVSRALASATETTAGMLRERQMIDVWLVGPPLMVITPITAGVNCAVSAGEKSSPTKTMLPVSGNSSVIEMPAMFACTRLLKSCRSATRSSNAASPPSSSANVSTAIPNAAAALQPSARFSVATSKSSSSSSSIFSASKISALVPPALTPSRSRSAATDAIAPRRVSASAVASLLVLVQAGSAACGATRKTVPTAELSPTPRPVRTVPFARVKTSPEGTLGSVRLALRRRRRRRLRLLPRGCRRSWPS